MTFQLNKTLKKDSILITKLQLCQVRLINNSDFPWLILVPEQNDLIEITDLSNTEYELLNTEIKIVATALQKKFVPDKLNIATIGNVVSQMHIHIIARYKNDKLFPKPVWGYEFIPYSPKDLEDKINKLREAIDRS